MHRIANLMCACTVSWFPRGFCYFQRILILEVSAEQLNASNGVTHVLRTCYTKGKAYQFDDGVTMTNTNQCVTRTTRQGKYYVALCTTQDMCNNDCRTESTQPTLPPVEPPVPLGSVTCYDCVSTDGTDCQTNTCQGVYCLYGEKKVYSTKKSDFQSVV